MRYYDIQILNPGDGKELLHYTSHPRGNNKLPDPGALQIELDLISLFEGQASANSLIRIWGIPFEIASSGSDFNFKNCVIRGGMGKGLPLANPAQANILASGQIIQAFGNWIGTEMTLDLMLQPGLVKQAVAQEPRKLVVQWPANAPMKDMIDTTLKTGYPDLKRQIDISDNLKLPNDETAFYASMAQFAQYSKNLSRKILGADNYTGVEMFIRGDTVHVQDGTKKETPINILPPDLIGQPTWLAPNMVQATLVMRGDIKVGSYVKLPDGLINTQASSWSSFALLKARTAFKGVFWVNRVHHVGSFRQPDGRAWTTILDCLPTGLGDKFNPADLGPGAGVQTGPWPA